VFNQAVKRNIERFPADFAFQLTREEHETLRSQIVISKTERRGGRQYLPFAFTEHGAVMAASILNSPKAVEMSVEVVRAFIRLRQILASNRHLAARVDDLERKMNQSNATHTARRSSIVVTTGAGISLASGIPTFRGQDPGAVWKRDVTELGTFRYFREDPAGSWRWYMSRFDLVFAARPNAAHQALAALQTWQMGADGSFLLITQNIDTLHEQAGSLDLVKVHGSADRVRCAREGCLLGAPKGSLARGGGSRNVRA
jgi:hypothetical protein